MKQGLLFLVIVAVIVILGGMIFEGCNNIRERKQPIVVDLTYDMVRYQVDPAKVESTFNDIMLQGLEFAANRDSLTIVWRNHIYNPDNEPYVEEVAFHLVIEPEDVTQEQFNERYDL